MKCGGSGAFGAGSPHRPRKIWNSSDPTINGHLQYPHDLDGSLNESVPDKIRQIHTDYNNRPSNFISFIPVISSSSWSLQTDFVCLLFLQTHRETDRFFATSGVHLA